MSRWASFTLRVKSAKTKEKKDDVMGVLGNIICDVWEGFHDCNWRLYLTLQGTGTCCISCFVLMHFLLCGIAVFGLIDACKLLYYQFIFDCDIHFVLLNPQTEYDMPGRISG